MEKKNPVNKVKVLGKTERKENMKNEEKSFWKKKRF